MRLSDLTGSTGDALRNLGAFVTDLAEPTVRLGVTGLARAGKTVFITALVHNLTRGGRLPFFAPVAEGRVSSAWLEPQPDDTVPRFDYEAHLARLLASPPEWPESTRKVSELRVTLEYSPQGFWRRQLGVRRLHLDIVDYPGEWLLDLPLLRQSYAEWSREALLAARLPERAEAAAPFLEALKELDPAAIEDEAKALAAAQVYKEFLARVRGEHGLLSTLPPGRFLLPGEYEGSPALTFVPLDIGEASPERRTLGAMMSRRYEAYKAEIVRPFFRDHFARLDRQVVLVDALAALNAGDAALKDLSRALSAILAAFDVGQNTWASAVFARRIDKVLFAATKADHLNQSSHDRLEGVLNALLAEAAERARFKGAGLKSLAIAAVRSTREAEMRDGQSRLPCIVGVPLPGERLGEDVFDGVREAAVFPGDLPEDAEALLRGEAAKVRGIVGDVRFLRFRPPQIAKGDTGVGLPHIRLDRALDFLVGDRLR